MSQSAPRSKLISLRLSVDQRRELLERAGHQALSVYIRMQLFPANDNISISKPIDHQAGSQILARLGQSKIPNNLELLANAMRSGSLVLDEESKSALLQACADIATIKELVMNSLMVEED